MKTELTTDRLIHAINNQLEGYTAEDALNILRDEYRFTDDEIRALGLDYLFDLTEPDEPTEPDEEPLKEYEIIYWEKLAQRIVIPAHSEEEAKTIFERDFLTPGFDSYEMEFVDSDWTLVNPD